MNADQIEKLYRELPEAHRVRWSATEFAQLSERREENSVVFTGSEQHAITLHRKLEKNEFGGLASAVGVKIDSWIPTYIEAGAFARTLADKTERARVKVFYQHSVPIGVPTHMEEMAQGLMVIGKVSETSVGSDVLTLMRDKAVDEMSIGFDPVEYFYREDKATKELCRHITDVRLWEFGPVGFGANRGAKITVVNSLRQADAQTVDLEKLATLVAEQLSAQRRLKEDDPAAVQAEIERLQKLLPAHHAYDYGQDLERLAALSAV